MKLSILINAYACSPNMGSEPGMAWNWCTNLAKYCELHIITEGEFRDKIEAVLPTLPQGKNMHFHYNPASSSRAASSKVFLGFKGEGLIRSILMFCTSII